MGIIVNKNENVRHNLNGSCEYLRIVDFFFFCEYNPINVKIYIFLNVPQFQMRLVLTLYAFFFNNNIQLNFNKFKTLNFIINFHKFIVAF